MFSSVLCILFLDLAPIAQLSINVEVPVVSQEGAGSLQAPNKFDPDVSDKTDDMNGSDNTLTNEDRNERINEFYGLGKYNEKNGPQGNKNRIMSDMDVRANTLPVKKPFVGVTGEKDFRMRSLPDHAQSMPAIYHEQQPLSIEVPEKPMVNSYLNMVPASDSSGRGGDGQNQHKSAFRPLSSASNSLQRLSSPDNSVQHGQPGAYNKLPGHQTDVKRLSAASSQMSQPRSSWKQGIFLVQYLLEKKYGPRHCW